jgi:hypothetical protein
VRGGGGGAGARVYRVRERAGHLPFPLCSSARRLTGVPPCGRCAAGRGRVAARPTPSTGSWRVASRGSATGPGRRRRRLTRSVRAASATVRWCPSLSPRARSACLRRQALTPAAAGAAGTSSWLPSPMLDLSFGTKPPDAPKTDGEIVAQTTADCAVYATPGLVGCIAAADSIVTGKSFAEGLTSPFRHGCVSPASSARVPMLAFCHVAPPQRVACMNRGAAVQAAAKGVGTQAGLVMAAGGATGHTQQPVEKARQGGRARAHSCRSGLGGHLCQCVSSVYFQGTGVQPFTGPTSVRRKSRSLEAVV